MNVQVVMQIALTYISVTIADICFANGVESMHLLGEALSRNMLALFAKAPFLEVRKKYLGTMTLLARIHLPPDQESSSRAHFQRSGVRVEFQQRTRQIVRMD